MDLLPARKNNAVMKNKTFLLAALITLSLMEAIYAGAVFWHGIQPTDSLVFIWQIVFVVLLVLWVDADSKDYPKIYRPYEYGYLIFLFWLPYLPFYLWRTRGARGIAVFAGFLGLFYLGYLVQWLIYAVR